MFVPSHHLITDGMFLLCVTAALFNAADALIVSSFQTLNLDFN